MLQKKRTNFEKLLIYLGIENSVASALIRNAVSRAPGGDLQGALVDFRQVVAFVVSFPSAH